jgi:asparagine synthase (glutamine-hydrolysing)
LEKAVLPVRWRVFVPALRGRRATTIETSEGTTMCGIFAAMTRHGVSSDRCDAALKLLEHRGPDGTGIWTSRDGQWTLGHTRLSIIGLRNGSQPMTSPDGAVHVVVNGEFYG